MGSLAEDTGGEIGALPCALIITDERALLQNLIFFLCEVGIDFLVDFLGQQGTKGFQCLPAGLCQQITRLVVSGDRKSVV